MNNRDVVTMRRELLERFTRDFKDELFAATILEPDDDMSVPLVRVLFDEMGDVDDEAVAEEKMSVEEVMDLLGGRE